MIKEIVLIFKVIAVASQDLFCGVATPAITYLPPTNTAKKNTRWTIWQLKIFHLHFRPRTFSPNFELRIFSQNLFFFTGIFRLITYYSVKAVIHSTSGGSFNTIELRNGRLLFAEPRRPFGPEYSPLVRTPLFCSSVAAPEGQRPSKKFRSNEGKAGNLTGGTKLQFLKPSKPVAQFTSISQETYHCSNGKNRTCDIALGSRQHDYKNLAMSAKDAHVDLQKSSTISYSEPRSTTFRKYWQWLNRYKQL